MRLDLKVDPSRGKDRDGEDFAGVLSRKAGCCTASHSESDSSSSNKGWSKAQLSYCDRRRYRLSHGLRWLEGVEGMGDPDGDSNSASNDGTDSIDREWADNDGASLSLSQLLPLANRSLSSGRAKEDVEHGIARTLH